MIIEKQRSRLLITEYNRAEYKYLEDLVASMDNVFLYHDEDKHLVGIPTGMEKTIKKVFPKAEFIDNSDEYWDYARIHPVTHNATPRNQLQKDFINFVLEHAAKKDKIAGILSPGQGKTFMACYSAIELGLRTLIIVPTSSIKIQWGETLTGMFKVDPKYVKVVNKPTDFINVKEDFVVVSQASLASLNKTYDLEKIMKLNKFGIKVIDEVQMWFKNIIHVDANCNIANNWYLTGTFGRSGDRENAIYQEMFGDLAMFKEKDKKPTLFNRNPGNIYGMKPHVHCTMIWTKSGLSREEITKVTSSMRYSEREGKWMRFGISIPTYSSLVFPQDGTMTKYLKTVLTVIKNARNQVKYGRMLILAPTITACNIIVSYLEEIFPNMKIGTINSYNSKQDNIKNKAECDTIVSTVQSAGTGFDMKDLSILIMATPFKSWILADQTSGRLRRRPDGKDTYMWDVVDAQIKQLRVWANVRADVFKRKSKEFKVVDM